MDDAVLIFVKIERVIVEAIGRSRIRPVDFIREAVLEKLRALSLLDS